MPRKIIYSALVGDYDKIPNHFKSGSDEWQYVLFTDLKFESDFVNGWEVRPLKFIIEEDNVKTARWHKINSHLLFEECVFSVWLDCNITVVDDFFYNRIEELNDNGIIISSIKHPERSCIYDEIEECLKLGKDKLENIIKNKQLIIQNKYPKNNGLFESNLLFRKHNDSTKAYNQRWWDILSIASRRDQLSMCFVLWEQNLICESFFVKKNISTRNSPHFVYNSNHNINTDFIEISNLDFNHLHSELNKSITENNRINTELDVSVKENNRLNNELNISIEENNRLNNELGISLNENSRLNNYLIISEGIKSKLLTKLKKIKRTVSYKVFFKVEIFIKESLQRLFQ